jgi:nucleotide-binding universal stress UspA family protein
MKKILVATDGSEHSAKALKEAIKLAGSLKAEVTVITVAGGSSLLASAFPDSYPADSNVIDKIKDDLIMSAKKILAEAEKLFQENGIAVNIKLAEGHPADKICSEANMGNYDLVVMGSRGLGGITELFLGSVSNKVVHCAKPSVVVVK